MICKWCNKEVDDNAKFCTNCGGNLINIENSVPPVQQPVIEQPIMTVPVQQPVNSIPPVVEQPKTVQEVQQPIMASPVQQEKANVGLVILSCFIPLAGLIIFLVKKDTDKKTAKASGLAALISFGVSILITIIAVIGITMSAKNFINNVEDYVDENVTTTPGNNYIDEEENFDEPDNTQPNTNISTEWKNYEFTVNNKTFSLPCTYAELSNAMLSEMQSSHAKSYIQSGYYALINLYKNDKLDLYIEMLNDTDQDILYTDAKITRVSQTKYQVSNGSYEITFPGGLKVGQTITKDELVNLFGEPSDVYNYTSEGYVSDEYSYFEYEGYTTINYYEIRVVNGVIDQLTLDNRNYE